MRSEVADLAFGSEFREDRSRRPRGRFGFRQPPGPPQQRREVARRLGPELRPPMRLGPLDHLAQRPLGGHDVAFQHHHSSRDSQIFSLVNEMGHLAPDLPHLVRRLS